MKITPLEIRQKSFEKVFRGYDKDEVSAFLNTLSHEWEKTLDEYKEVKIRLDASEKEVEKLRQVENSLFKTLKTAEDTGANLVEQAQKSAELKLQESNMRAEKMVQDAQNKSAKVIEDAEKARNQIVEDMMDGLKDLRNDYKRLEGLKEDLLQELKHLTSDTLEKVERFKSGQKFDVDSHLAKARDYARSVKQHSGDTGNDNREQKAREQKRPENQSQPQNQNASNHSSENTDDKGRSFFDEIK